MKILYAIAFLLFPASALALEPTQPTPAFRAAGVAIFAASAGDLISTEIGLRQPGIVEANLLMRQQSVRIGAHLAAPALMWYASDKIYHRGQKKTAWCMRLGMIAGYSFLAGRNFRIGGQ